MRSLLLALALAACAHGSGQSPTTNGAQSSNNSGQMICKEERPTGSNISREVCRTPEQMEEDRKRAGDLLQQTPPAPAPPAGAK